jgi:CRP/FNR family transcriptional activator FtrB
MGAGDLLLVPPALLRAPYMVSAQAASDLLVVMIPAGEFRRLAESEISLSVAVNKLLAKHWRLLLRQVLQTKTHDADTRLKNYLLDLAGDTAGPAHLTLPGTKKDLAAHLGVRSETLSRSLRRLAPLGVRSTAGGVEIDDLARLRSGSQRGVHVHG